MPRNLRGAAMVTARSAATLQRGGGGRDGAEQSPGPPMIAALEMIEQLLESQLRAIDGRSLCGARGGEDDTGNAEHSHDAEDRERRGGGDHNRADRGDRNTS